MVYQGARRGYALAGVGLVVLIVVGAGLVVQNDPLPAPPAVPLSEGDNNSAAAPVPVPIVPLKEGDGRRSRQGVRRAAISKPAPKPETPDEPPKQLVVKLLTDDPNIVIYWLVDQNGD